MPLVLAALEVMDKELPLWFIFLAFLTTGTVGMLVARRRPLLSALFVTVILALDFGRFWSSGLGVNPLRGFRVC